MFVQDRTYIETNIRAAAVYKQKLAHFPAKPAKRTAEHYLKHWFSSSSSSSSTPPSNTNYVTVLIVQVCSAAIDQNKSGWKYTPKRHQFFLHKFLLCRFECRCYTPSPILRLQARLIRSLPYHWPLKRSSPITSQAFKCDLHRKSLNLLNPLPLVLLLLGENGPPCSTHQPDRSPHDPARQVLSGQVRLPYQMCGALKSGCAVINSISLA